MEIGEKKVLEYIIERLLQVLSLDEIVIATSNIDSDNPIAEFAEQKGISCFRGSLDHVAERFYLAGKSKNWDYAVRINGDNIFVDTGILKDMIHIANTNQYDLVSNVKGRTFPKGMSVEIVRLDYYASKLSKITQSDLYREHVTLYLYDNDSSTHFYYINEILPEASGLQMALDTMEDLERTKKIMSYFTQEHWNYNMKEIYKIWRHIENESNI